MFMLNKEYSCLQLYILWTQGLLTNVSFYYRLIIIHSQSHSNYQSPSTALYAQNYKKPQELQKDSD